MAVEILYRVILSSFLLCVPVLTFCPRWALCVFLADLLSSAWRPLERVLFGLCGDGRVFRADVHSLTGGRWRSFFDVRPSPTWAPASLGGYSYPPACGAFWDTAHAWETAHAPSGSGPDAGRPPVFPSGGVPARVGATYRSARAPSDVRGRASWLGHWCMVRCLFPLVELSLSLIVNHLWRSLAYLFPSVVRLAFRGMSPFPLYCLWDPALGHLASISQLRRLISKILLPALLDHYHKFGVNMDVFIQF